MDKLMELKKYAGRVLFFSLLSILLLNFFDYLIPWPLIVVNVGLLAALFLEYVISQNMIFYILRRIGESLITIVIISTITFTLLRVLPGGPFDEEKPLPPEIKANIEAKYKLNEPLMVQYWYYMSGLVQGDLGESYKYLGRNVSEILADALPNSLQLGAYALLIAYLLGVPLGLIAASKHNSSVDNASMFVAISGISMPNFVLAALLVLVFCFWFPIFPPAFWDGPEFYVLPMIALGVRPAAVIARLTRASVLEVIRADYIRTARAKGLAENVVRFKHVLKNSLIPVLTFSGPLIAGILTGSFIIELIFNVPGMGRHFVQSVSNRDYPLIMGVTLVYSTILILSNLLVDLLYSYFDPRIKLS